MGILFSVHKVLGNRYQEKYYQRAIEEALKMNALDFKKEVLIDLPESLEYKRVLNSQYHSG